MPLTTGHGSFRVGRIGPAGGAVIDRTECDRMRWALLDPLHPSDEISARLSHMGPRFKRRRR